MAEIIKGTRVVVVKGRKAKGVTGTVFWLGDNKYGEGKRLGIEGDDGETHWVPEEYVEETDIQAVEVEPPQKGDAVAWANGDDRLAGTVFWVGESKSGKGWRVGVKDAADETFWLDARQLEVLASSADQDDEEPPPF